jgi:sodium transport system permease protein
MPVFMLGTAYFVSKSQAEAKVKRFSVGLKEDVKMDGLEDALRSAGFGVVPVEQPRTGAEKKTVDIGVHVEKGSAQPAVKVYMDSASAEVENQVARSRLQQVLNDLRDRRVKAGLIKAGINPGVLKPFTIETVNIAPPRKVAGSFLGVSLGFILVIFMLSGGMYPAIDMTAGEKERRTMEMLLSSAASREEIVIGKLLATLSATISTSLLSVASFAISFYGSRRVGDPTGPFAKITEMPLDASMIALLALASIPMAILAAAVTLAVAVPARSHKEATTYVTPVLFVGMFLGMATVLPGAHFNPTTLQFIPVANFCKVVKDLLVGEWSWKFFGTVLAANTVYAGIAVSTAIRKFKDESVLFRV